MSRQRSPLRLLPLAAWLVACASGSAPAPRTVLLASPSEAIVLLPLNVPAVLPERLEEAAPRVWDTLREYLEAHEATLKTVAFPTARRLWIESIREAREASPRAGFAEAARIFVSRLSDHAEFGTVLFASLLERSAAVEGRFARWDGAVRAVAIDEGAWRGRVDEETPFGGALPAASLHVVVVDAAGERVHEGRSGLALLAKVRLAGRPELGVPRFEIRDEAEPLGDREANLDGIARALSPFVRPLAPPLAPDGDPPADRS